MNKLAYASLHKVALAAAALVLFVFVLANSCLAQERPEEILTNTDVVRMVKYKLGTEIILEKIAESNSRFDLSSTALIQLSKAGVSNEIIAAMQEHTKQSPGKSIPAEASKPAQKGGPSDKPVAWKLEEAENPMDNTSNLRGSLNQVPPSDPQGRIQAEASCGSGSLDLVIAYFAGTGIDNSFQVRYPQTTATQTQTSAPLYGTGFMGIAAGFANVLTAAATALGNAEAEQQNREALEQSPWVDVLMKADANLLGSARAKAIYTNAVRISLTGSTLDQIVDAQRVILSFPRPSGTPVYFDLHPSDSGFQLIASMCGAVVPITPDIIAAGRAQVSPQQLSEGLKVLLPAAAEKQHLPPDFYRSEQSRLINIVNSCALLSKPLLQSLGGGDFKSPDRFGNAFKDCETPSTPQNLSGELRGGSAGEVQGRPTDLYIRSHIVGGRDETDPVGIGLSIDAGSPGNPIVKHVIVRWDSSSGRAPSPAMWKGSPSNPVGIKFEEYYVGPTWIPLSGTVSMTYRVLGMQHASVKVEMLRAPDVGGHPGEWSVVQNDSKTLGEGAFNYVSFHDTPQQPGRYWYGTHVTESTHREAREPAPLLVRVASNAELAASSPDVPESLFPGGADIVLSTPILAPQITPVEEQSSEQSATPLPAPPSVSTPEPSISTSRMVVLTRSMPSQLRDTEIKAPGRGKHNFNGFVIDARDFPRGGTLDIQIRIASDSRTDGSFDLFAGDKPDWESQGNHVQGRYDVVRGSQAQISYPFRTGQLFVLNLEGNWFSDKGATGAVRFTATVRPR
jgi:hypothetical protein